MVLQTSIEICNGCSAYCAGDLIRCTTSSPGKYAVGKMLSAVCNPVDPSVTTPSPPSSDKMDNGTKTEGILILAIIAGCSGFCCCSCCFFCPLAIWRARKKERSEIKKQLCIKYVRELQKEEMTVRLQLILHEDLHTFCVRRKIPESNVVYVQQAIALLAEVQLQDVKLELTSGMPHAVFCRQQSRASSPLSWSSESYESYVSVSSESRGCLSSSNNLQVAFGSNVGSGTERIKPNTVEEMHTFQDVTSEHEMHTFQDVTSEHGSGTERIKPNTVEEMHTFQHVTSEHEPATVVHDLQESTIYIDILVNLRSRRGACQAIKNLSEEQIDKSFKLHGIHQHFHVISPAISQLYFALGSKPLFYLHPLPMSASAVLLQAKTRRMLIKRGMSSLSARFRPGHYEDKEDSNNSIHSEHKSTDRLPRESWVDLRSEFKMREALEKHYRFRNVFHSRTPSDSSENSENKVR